MRATAAYQWGPIDVRPDAEYPKAALLEQVMSWRALAYGAGGWVYPMGNRRRGGPKATAGLTARLSGTRRNRYLQMPNRFVWKSKQAYLTSQPNDGLRDQRQLPARRPQPAYGWIRGVRAECMPSRGKQRSTLQSTRSSITARGSKAVRARWGERGPLAAGKVELRPSGGLTAPHQDGCEVRFSPWFGGFTQIVSLPSGVDKLGGGSVSPPDRITHLQTLLTESLPDTWEGAESAGCVLTMNSMRSMLVFRGAFPVVGLCGRLLQLAASPLYPGSTVGPSLPIQWLVRVGLPRLSGVLHLRTFARELVRAHRLRIFRPASLSSGERPVQVWDCRKAAGYYVS